MSTPSTNDDATTSAPRLDVAVLGVGMTHFAMRPGTSMPEFATAAAFAALSDADMTPSDVDLVVFANAADGVLTGQEMIRGEVAFQRFGLARTPIINIENACASSSSALNIACAYVSAGLARNVLVVGAEKISNSDKRRSMSMFSTAADLDAWPQLRADVEQYLLGAAKPEAEAGPPQSLLMDLYAGTARRLFAETEWDIRAAAAVAVKNRDHAAANPVAQFRDAISVEQVLESRMIADPLRLLMCSPLADGGAALIVGPTERHPIRARIVASQVRSGGTSGELGATRAAATAAYEQAGIGPREVDLLEVHDASAPAELGSYESLGLHVAGEGQKFLADRAPYLGGRQPVNPSGGLLSRGHPIGATGLAQLVEIVTQVSGRAGERQVPGARVGLAQNSGGHLNGEEAISVVTIVTAP